MISGIRYTHTNLIARDWRALADFYQTVLGCELVPPVRDYRASDVEGATGVEGAGIAGVHLRLPGGGADGPTLEIYSYVPGIEGPTPTVNRPGFAHLAFSVDDVDEARQQILAGGGGPVAGIVTSTTATGARVTWCYVTDPEGNALELQSWDHSSES